MSRWINRILSLAVAIFILAMWFPWEFHRQARRMVVVIPLAIVMIWFSDSFTSMVTRSGRVVDNSSPGCAIIFAGWLLLLAGGAMLWYFDSADLGFVR